MTPPTLDQVLRRLIGAAFDAGVAAACLASTLGFFGVAAEAEAANAAAIAAINSLRVMDMGGGSCSHGIACLGSSAKRQIRSYRSI